MPTNVTAEYKKAEAEYKAARELRDRLVARCGRCCGRSPNTRGPSTSRVTSRRRSRSSPMS